MPDYPDWQRIVRLVASDITLPISIEATTVTLDVDIVAQTVGNLAINIADAVTLDVDIVAQTVGNLAVNVAAAVTIDVDIVAQTVGNLAVNIAASAITLNVNIAASAVTLNVNLTSQSANIDIDFADQSVAVFDAAKWFAHQASQIFVTGAADVANNSSATMCSRTVPTGKTFFIVGLGFSLEEAGTPNSMETWIRVAGTTTVIFGSQRGGVTPFDTPLRATAGQLVEVKVAQFGSGATLSCSGSMWGYDE